VTSYKLIARGTVEEKIVALQEKKRRMIGEVVDAQSAPETGGLSEAEIFALLE
jgi:SNF2 family DNA or RNA helicase